MGPTRSVPLIVAVTALLIAGPASRRESAVWPRVETGTTALPSLRAAALQALNAEGGIEYAIDRVVDHRTGQASHLARNERHALTAAFTADGPRITTGESTFTLGLASYGRAERRGPIAMGDWRAEGSRIERASIGGAALTEWYVNGPLGLEQGFTLPSAPEGEGRIEIGLTVSDPWIALPGGGSMLRLHNQATNQTLGYTGLHAVDAAGRLLVAALAADAGGIRITVEEGDAAYPITIDPFIQQQVLTPFDGVNNDSFGFSVALDGDTAVIGARDRATGRGAAYVFVRSAAGTWSLQALLVPQDPAPGSFFGHDVAISGNSIAVGAFNGQRAVPGSAYVFVRFGTAWTQQAKLTAPDGRVADFFGVAVALDGETLAVGAPGQNVEPSDRLGAVYVFVRSGFSWLLQEKLQSPDTVAPNLFGSDVALSANTLIAGAPREDDAAVQNSGRAYAFVRTGAAWSLQQVLAPNPPVRDLFWGSATALAGDRALVGGATFVSIGAAIAFERDGTTWAQTARFESPLVAAFGSSLAIDGSTGVVGAPPPQPNGFVTLVRFRQTGPPLAETVPARRFGRSVDISGSTILIGDRSSNSPGEVDVLVEASEPPAPPSVSPPVVTGSTVDLAWTASAGATRYQLRAGTFPGGSNAFNGDVGNVTTLKAVNVPNGSYFIRVFAVNASGESAASNEVRADVGVPGPCTPPAAPANLTRGVNGSLVTLTWSASTGATSYVVEAGSASGLANLAVIDTGSAMPGLAANAPPGTYFVRVRAKNSCGLSAASNQITVTVN